MKLLSRSEYEEWIAKTRDERMDWWRRARFGMFVHFGLYSQAGRHEWCVMELSRRGIRKACRPLIPSWCALEGSWEKGRHGHGAYQAS